MITIKPSGSTCVCNSFTKESVTDIFATFITAARRCNSSAASIIKVRNIRLDMSMGGRWECRRFTCYIIPCDICNSSAFAYGKRKFINGNRTVCDIGICNVLASEKFGTNGTVQFVFA